jgi:hypothetical protein
VQGVNRWVGVVGPAPPRSTEPAATHRPCKATSTIVGRRRRRPRAPDCGPLCAGDQRQVVGARESQAAQRFPSSRHQISAPLRSRKEDDMTTQHHQVITKILIGAAVALGAYVGGAAPVSADGNPIGSAPNPFGGLSCSCRETAPPGSPALTEGIERGIREGRTAWLPRLAIDPAPATP